MTISLNHTIEHSHDAAITAKFFLEIITRPYGSGGLDAEHPNPLLSRP